LVEFTCFSPAVIDERTLEKRLDTFIQTLVDEHEYSISRREKAFLPMFFINKNDTTTDSAHNTVYAGIAGGAMRASTGYSFVNSVHWAKQCAHQLHFISSLYKKAPINPIYAIMDSIMLTVMLNDIRFGVIIFEQLFKKVSADRFARFMLQQANPIDFLSIVWAMPKIPFCKAAWQHCIATRSLFAAREGDKSE
jgi:lycopene beta-cyclase